MKKVKAALAVATVAASTGTAFAQESAAQAGENAPINSMMALFAKTPDSDKELEARVAKLTRRNLPPMITPDSVPIGVAIQGTILKIVNSPVSTIKGKLLWLEYKGREFMFPCTGTIRSALAPGLKDDEGAKLLVALEKEVGNFFYAERLPDKDNKQFKKRMFMFDVRTGKA